MCRAASPVPVTETDMTMSLHIKTLRLLALYRAFKEGEAGMMDFSHNELEQEEEDEVEEEEELTGST